MQVIDMSRFYRERMTFADRLIIYQQIWAPIQIWRDAGMWLINLPAGWEEWLSRHGVLPALDVIRKQFDMTLQQREYRKAN